MKTKTKKQSADLILASLSSQVAARIGANETVKASIIGAGITLNDLQSKLAEAARKIPKLNVPSVAGQSTFGPWVTDVVVPAHEAGETWECVVSGSDGKLYCVEFKIEEDHSVSVVGEPEEVERTTDYEYVDAMLAQAEADVVKAGEFKGNQHTKDYSAAQQAAHDATQKALGTYNYDQHKDAADKHREAAKKSKPGPARNYHENQAKWHDRMMGIAEPVAASDPTLRAGDVPGHEFHGNQYTAASSDANKASTESEHASEKAKASGAAADHAAAASAHHKADMAHLKAKSIARHEGKSEKIIDQHHDLSQHHLKMAVEHRGEAEKLTWKGPGANKASELNVKDVIHCRSSGVPITASDKWEQDRPVTFQYMPGGVTTIVASFNDRPIRLTVNCDEDTAKVVQQSFDSLKASAPKQKPFGCVEHREQEASVLPESFAWKDDPEPGVYCTAVPTELGVRNVNGRIHRSWSPSFTTDAEYHKATCQACERKVSACECDGTVVFPVGARGHEDTPANITGIAFSVGSLTNKPAFKNILPVRAKEATTAASPTKPNAEQHQLKMKVKVIKAFGTYAVGTVQDLQDTEAVKAINEGNALDFVSASALEEKDAKLNAVLAKQKASEQNLIKAAFGRARDRGAVPKADDSALTKAIERHNAGADAELLCELFDALQVQASVKNKIEDRLTTSGDNSPAHVQLQGVSLQDAGKAYIAATEPQLNLIRSGKLKDAVTLSKEAGFIMQQHIMAAMAKGGDFMLRDVIKAADYTDPNSQVGTLATGLILMRNLGFLKNKLPWLPYFTTDLRNEPAQFGQPIFTRYITPPGTLTWVPGVGFTSDATTITNASAGTNQSGVSTQTSGTVTKSAPGATDVTVTMNQFRATEIEFPISSLAATVRNLFAEQRGAQTYALAELVNKYVLGVLFAATWTGTVTSFSLGNFNLAGFLNVKNRMELSKIPDMGRVALLHSYYYDGLQADANLLTSKAILALINKDQSSFEDADMPAIFGVKPIQSQLAVGTIGSATLGSATVAADGTTVSFGSNNAVGFAGNISSAVFAARVPQDFTQAAAQLGIPASSAVEIITEPDSGLSLMVFKYVDNGKMSISTRVCLMYGASQGDPRVGFILKP